MWTVYRQPGPGRRSSARSQLIRGAQRALLVAGGGLIYSEAPRRCGRWWMRRGIPVWRRKPGAERWFAEHPLRTGGVGGNRDCGRNQLARNADVVIGVGTRWSDFTTASKSAFQDPDVRFVNVNVAGFDAAKHAGLPVLGDARTVLEMLAEALAGWRVDPDWEASATHAAGAWADEVARLVATPGEGGVPSQAQVIGALNDAAGETGVLVCAAGSAPGDLHKLWRARDPRARAITSSTATPAWAMRSREAWGSSWPHRTGGCWCWWATARISCSRGELVTAVAERVPMTIVLVDNQGYASIGALSRSLGSAGFGTQYRYPVDGVSPVDGLAADPLPLDLAANAASLGARVVPVRTVDELRAALANCAGADGPVVIHITVDRYAGVPAYDGWWDVPVAEVAEPPAVRAAGGLRPGRRPGGWMGRGLE